MKPNTAGKDNDSKPKEEEPVLESSNRERAAGGSSGGKQKEWFRKEELQEYYAPLDIVLEGESLDTLWRLTDGWGEAVRLLGQHLGRGELLTAGHMDDAVLYLHKHFQERCHQPLNAEQRQAVILLSMLDSFTMDMATELRLAAVEDLNLLAHTNRFLCRDSETGSYFFHKLYRQFLEGKQIEVPKKERAAFLRRAAYWLECQGRILEALACYVGSQDYDRMVPLLRQLPVPGLVPDRAAQIAGLLEQVPEDYMAGHPVHRMYLILTKFFSGEEELALLMHHRLQRELEAKSRSPEEDRVLGELYLSLAYQSWRDGAAQYLHYLRKAGPLLPEGTSCLDSDGWYSSAGGALQFVEMMPGDLDKVKAVVLESIPHAKILLPKTGAGICYIAVAEVYLYRIEFEQAAEYAGKAVAEAVSAKQWGIAAEACYLLQRIAMATGGLDDLLSYLEQVQGYTKKMTCRKTYSVSHVSRFHEYLYFGLYHLFEDWSRHVPQLDCTGGKQSGIGRELFIYALYKVFAQRQYYPALDYIDNAIRASRSSGMWFSRLRLVILKAVVYDNLEQPGIAAKLLVEAYRMSGSNTILFPFVELGEDMLNLLHAAEPYLSYADIPAEWLEQVAAASRQYAGKQQMMIQEYLKRHPHIKLRKLEQLTKREYRVLKLACMGRSTVEIAGLMAVSPPAVDTYFDRIYKKFGVNGRQAAVRMATAEGILL